MHQQYITNIIYNISFTNINKILSDIYHYILFSLIHTIHYIIYVINKPKTKIF